MPLRRHPQPGKIVTTYFPSSDRKEGHHDELYSGRRRRTGDGPRLQAHRPSSHGQRPLCPDGGDHWHGPAGWMRGQPSAVGREVYSPMVPQGCAHLLIGFEPSEAVRCLPYLRPDGQVVVSKRAVKPITASLAGSPYDGSEMLDYLKTHVQKVILVDSEAICQQAGSAKVLNVSLLGAAVASGALASPFRRWRPPSGSGFRSGLSR